MAGAKREGLVAEALEVRVLAAIIHKVSAHDLEQRLREQGGELSPLQYGVLQYLRHRSATLSVLSRHLLLAPTTLVPVVDALEAKGLVARGVDPQDRRRNPIALTAAARQKLSALPPVGPSEALVQALDALGPERAAALLDLLRALVAQLAGGEEYIRPITAEAQREAQALPCGLRMEPHQGRLSIVIGSTGSANSKPKTRAKK